MQHNRFGEHARLLLGAPAAIDSEAFPIDEPGFGTSQERHRFRDLLRGLSRHTGKKVQVQILLALLLTSEQLLDSMLPLTQASKVDSFVARHR